MPPRLTPIHTHTHRQHFDQLIWISQPAELKMTKQNMWDIGDKIEKFKASRWIETTTVSASTRQYSCQDCRHQLDTGVVHCMGPTLAHSVEQSAIFPARQQTLREQIRSITRALSVEIAKTVVRSFISSRLDYCNSLLFAISDSLLRRPQAAASLITFREVKNLPSSVASMANKHSGGGRLRPRARRGRHAAPECWGSEISGGAL